MANIFDGVPGNAADEILTELLSHSGVRIERIVSTGQATPIDAPYDQDHDEWVLLLSGSAGLWIENDGETELRPRDCVMIRAHLIQFVARHYADQAPPAVCYFYSPDRKADHPRTHLKAFRGILHADGYAGYVAPIFMLRRRQWARSDKPSWPIGRT